MERSTIPVLIPQLNPNEREALLVKLHVQNGQQINKGDVLCILETTKATAEVCADIGGYITGIRYSEGEMVRTGDILCYISDSPETVVPESSFLRSEEEGKIEGIVEDMAENTVDLPQGLRITKPALQLASAIHLNLNRLPKGPLITKEMLQKHILFSNVESCVPQKPKFDPSAIVIYGGGGHGKSLIELIRSLHVYQIVGILDDGLSLKESYDNLPSILGIPILGGGEKLAELYEQGIRLAVNAVGGIGDIQIRVKIFERLANYGFACPTLIHPSALVESSAILSNGIQVFPHAYIGSEARIGFGVIINTGAIVSHECHIGNYVNLSPGAILAGGVEIEDCVLVGMGATINIGVKIGSGTRIGNNATVKADVPANSIIKAGAVFPS